jgi:hypothetical protein
MFITSVYKCCCNVIIIPSFDKSAEESSFYDFWKCLSLSPRERESFKNKYRNGISNEECTAAARVGAKRDGFGSDIQKMFAREEATLCPN